MSAMKPSLLLLLTLVACAPPPAPPVKAASSPRCEPRLALDPLQHDVACLDSVELCLTEAKEAKLRDPLDSYTPEQEEIAASRGCLIKLRECRSGAWR